MMGQNSQPKVSIILPVYNVGKWLPECLDSILAQTLTEWEAILVIDGATDDSLQIAQSYASADKRFRVFGQENAGQGAARNRGVKESRGEYLFFLDPDDVVPPNALEVLVEKAEATGADITIGDVIVFTDGEKITFGANPATSYFRDRFSGMPDVFGRTEITDYELFYNSIYFMVVWMKLFRASVWKNHGIIAPVGLTMGEDQIAVKHMAFVANKITTVPHVVIYYRRRKNSATARSGAKAFGIFTSYQYALELYRQLNLPVQEITLLHRAYLHSYLYHMQNFVPYYQWYGYYCRICQSIGGWPMRELDATLLTPRERLSIQRLKRSGFVYFITMCVDLYFGAMLRNGGVKTLHHVRNLLPLSLRRGIARALGQLIPLCPDEGRKVIVRKIQFHLVGE